MAWSCLSYQGVSPLLQPFADRTSVQFGEKMFDFCWLALLMAAYLKAQMGREVNCQNEQMAFRAPAELCTFPSGKRHPCSVHFSPLGVKRSPRQRMPAQSVFWVARRLTRTAAMLPSPCLFFKRGEFCNIPHRKYKRYYENPPKFLKLENRLDEAFISYQIGFLK